MNRLSSRGRLPRLEVLEDRRVLSCTVVAQDGVLSITGDSRANDVQLVDDGAAVTVTCDGQAETFEDISKVVVSGRQGSDSVRYELTGELAADRQVVIDLGNGHDALGVTLGGKVGAEADFSLTAFGGNGNDKLRVAGDGADVAEGASLAVRLSGGNGKDMMMGRFDLLLGGSLTFAADGGNGNDVVIGNLTVGAGSTGDLKARVLGWNGADRLRLDVADNSGDDGDPATEDESALESVVATLDGGRGKDAYYASDLVDVVSAERKI
jgi:hypothetical protein